MNLQTRRRLVQLRCRSRRRRPRRDGRSRSWTATTNRELVVCVHWLFDDTLDTHETQSARRTSARHKRPRTDSPAVHDDAGEHDNGHPTEPVDEDRRLVSSDLDDCPEITHVVEALYAKEAQKRRKINEQLVERSNMVGVISYFAQYRVLNELTGQEHGADASLFDTIHRGGRPHPVAPCAPTSSRTSSSGAECTCHRAATTIWTLQR